MAFPTFAPALAPSPGSGKDTTPRTVGVAFGDGYSQNSPDGINNLEDTWNMVWDSLTTAQADYIENFFRDRKGAEPFYYPTAPRSWGANSTKFRAVKWNRIPTKPNYDSITATFNISYAIDS